MQKHQPCSQATFSLSHDVIFFMVSPLLERLLVSFNLQSAICGLQSAVCSLQSAVCKCHTPQQQLEEATVGTKTLKAQPYLELKRIYTVSNLQSNELLLLDAFRRVLA